MTAPVIVWFRQDLRLSDNPALIAANKTGRPILPLYILDDINSGEWKMGSASRWWLHESLKSLNASLKGNLCFGKGNPLDIINALLKQTGAQDVFWNRCYEPWRIARDSAIKKSLKTSGIEAQSFNGAVLFEPQITLKSDFTPYRVFTPYYKNACLQNAPEPRHPQAAPQGLNLFHYEIQTLDQLELMPKLSWHKTMQTTWTPGEEGAQEHLAKFLDTGLKNYKDGRNYPAKNNVSRLSPHLHFGEISPHQAWYGAQQAMIANNCESDGAHFMSELGWREFSNNLLYHTPSITRENLQSKFDAFEWQDNPEALKAWQTGQTGYPIIDAGMRELWHTGYMHNRVRMIVGSFLVKNLLLHWHHGEDWFWDTLLDADLANNSTSWQWIAGCGADAAPYFRIFNPVTQGQKFDPNGDYVRKYVPEIAALPDKYLHSPWEAKDDLLAKSNITLGKDYPLPIVDLKSSRERALQAFAKIKAAQ